MKRTMFACIILAVLTCPAVFGQQPRISVNALPYGTVPLGSSVDSFNFGGGAELSAVLIPSAFESLGAAGGALFTTLPLESKQSSIWSTVLFGGPFYRLPLGERLSLFPPAEPATTTGAPWDGKPTARTGAGSLLAAGAVRSSA